MAPWTLQDMPDQTGRTVLVTGANSGLGLHSAQALAARGALVLLGCRDRRRAAVAQDKVAEVATGPAPEVVALDLADLASVRAAAAAVRDRVDHLDLLLNNAGVMALPHQVTAEGFEMQFGTNHLGHFALTGHLLSTLTAAPRPRVVTVSSNAHRIGRMRWDDLNFERRYRRWRAYGQSKLANLLFVYELDRRATEAGSPLVSVAAHPGYADTYLQLAAGGRLRKRAMALSNRLFAQPAEMGALPQLYAATAAGVAGGEYFGPDRLFANRGHPTKVKASRRARDPHAAARLWEASEELTDVTYRFG